MAEDERPIGALVGSARLDMRVHLGPRRDVAVFLSKQIDERRLLHKRQCSRADGRKGRIPNEHFDDIAKTCAHPSTGHNEFCFVFLRRGRHGCAPGSRRGRGKGQLDFPYGAPGGIAEGVFRGSLSSDNWGGFGRIAKHLIKTASRRALRCRPALGLMAAQRAVSPFWCLSSPLIKRRRRVRVFASARKRQ